ncbi:MAG: hypothetical protein B7C24_08835 [Bacteroidetes bacterium 4572_77]|nr:MAG: hypothetical protein B7C24_08835 [Bacteroidetes bacterium 4572_77]
MNDLINKYQDEDLTNEELRQLNDAIKNDDDIKNNIISLSVVDDFIKSEKRNTDMPYDFFDEVEDGIMMKYLQEVPESETNYIIGLDSTDQRFKYVNTFKYFAVASIVLFFSLFSINEFIFDKSKLIACDLEKLESQYMVIYNDAEHNNFRNIRRSSINNDTDYSNDLATEIYTKTNEGIAILINMEDESIARLFSDLADEVSYLDNEQRSIDERSLIEIISDEIVFSPIDVTHSSLETPRFRDIQNYLSSYINNVPTKTLENEFILSSNQYDCAFNGSYNVMSYGIETNPEKVSVTFAQSVGLFKESNKYAFGFEFGFNQLNVYSFKTVSFIDNDIPLPIANVGNLPGSDHNNDIDKRFDISNGNSTSTKIKVEQQVSLIFADLYYEYQIMNTQNTAITGRVGFGVCGDNLLGVAKVYGTQRLYNNLFFVMGVENRTFGFKYFDTQNNNYLSMFNITSGLKYIF